MEMKHKNQKVRELLDLLDWNQNQLAKYLGVTHVAMHHWMRGTSEPTGINKTTIMLALHIGKTCPDLLRASRTLPLPEQPYGDVQEFFRTDVGLHYYFGTDLNALLRDIYKRPFKRAALLLNLIAVFQPETKARMVEGFPGIVNRARKNQIEEQLKRDKRARERVLESRSRSEHIRTFHKDMTHNPYPW